MKTFTDTAGRTWTVTINVDAIKRVKSLLGVNLMDAIEGAVLAAHGAVAQACFIRAGIVNEVAKAQQ